jgi:hypothetical protein
MVSKNRARLRGDTAGQLTRAPTHKEHENVIFLNRKSVSPRSHKKEMNKFLEISI